MKIFLKGDCVVMHSCLESNGKNYGKIWICKGDSFFRGSVTETSEKVFLEGFSGSFGCKFLQLVKIPELASTPNKHDSDCDCENSSLLKVYPATPLLSLVALR